MKESKEKITKAQSGAKPSSSSSHPPDKSSSPQGQGQPDHRTKMVTRSSAERGKAATTTTTSATSSSSSSSSSKPQEKGKPTTAEGNKGKAGNKNHTGPGKKSVSPGNFPSLLVVFRSIGLTGSEFRCVLSSNPPSPF